MRTWSGARIVHSDDQGDILLLSIDLTGRGRWVYTYSLAPGLTVPLTLQAGPTMLPPDHPDIVSVVADLKERQRGYTGTG